MDRRHFLGSSLAATGGAVLAGNGILPAGAEAIVPASQARTQVPGAVTEAEIAGARFPDGPAGRCRPWTRRKDPMAKLTMLNEEFLTRPAVESCFHRLACLWLRLGRARLAGGRSLVLCRGNALRPRIVLLNQTCSRLLKVIQGCSKSKHAPCADGQPRRRHLRRPHRSIAPRSMTRGRSTLFKPKQTCSLKLARTRLTTSPDRRTDFLHFGPRTTGLWTPCLAPAQTCSNLIKPVAVKTCGAVRRVSHLLWCLPIAPLFHSSSFHCSWLAARRFCFRNLQPIARQSHIENRGF